MRVMIGPVEVSGIAAGLKCGFERLGIEADVVLGQPHPFAYGASSRRLVVRVWTRLGRLYGASQACSKPLRFLAWMPWRAWSVLVWMWALARYDAFIFLFSQTITDSAIEARLYRLFGKRVVMVYCGSDARPPYIDGPRCNYFGVARVKKIARIARQIRSKIWLHERAGFVCVNARVIGQFHRRPFVNWFAMGIPRECGADLVERPPGLDGASPVRILHSPSDPAAKGTALVVSIVEKLKRQGNAIDLVLLKGVPNEQVQAELRRCDFVIDQCWSDTPMAGLVVEAAHHGKPAVIAGYAATLQARSNLPALSFPTTYVHPDYLEDAVGRLVADAALRRDLGRRAFAFVRRFWSPEDVARRYLELLEGRIDPARLIEPGPPHYVQGFGLSEVRAREIVRELIRQEGVAALQLDHQPDLQHAFVTFAHGGDGQGAAP